MLRTCRDDGNGHLYRPKQIGLLGETIGPEPFDIPHSFVNGVVSLFPGGMSCFAVGCAVDDHQTSFGNGQLHQGWFADNGELQRPQIGDDALQAA